MQQRDKRHVSFAGHLPTDSASMTTMEPTDTLDTLGSMDLDLIDTVCNHFDINIDTLYAHAAKHCTEANKEKHLHRKPPKGSSLPHADVRHMMADNKELDINGTKYSARKANTAPQPSNITMDGITYCVNRNQGWLLQSLHINL